MKATVAKIKGRILETTCDYIREQNGQYALNTINQTLAPEIVETIKNLRPNQFYPEYYAADIFKTYKQLYFVGQDTLFEHSIIAIGQEIAKKDFASVFKVVSKLLTPREFCQGAVIFGKKYIPDMLDSIDLSQIDQKKVIIRCKNTQYYTYGNLVTLGWFLQTLQLVGGNHVVVTEEYAAQHVFSSPYQVFHLSWQ